MKTVLFLPVDQWIVDESVAHFDHELHRMSLLHFCWGMLHLSAD